MAWELVKDDYYSQSRNQLKTNDYTSHILVSSPKDATIPQVDNLISTTDGYKLLQKDLPKTANYSMIANASAEEPKIVEHDIPSSSSSEGGISCYLLQTQIPPKQSHTNRFDDWKFESPNRPMLRNYPLENSDGQSANRP